MLKSVEGTYSNGKIELSRPQHGINEEQAASLRQRLSAFIEDWESPEMAVYDDYDESKIQKR